MSLPANMKMEFKQQSYALAGSQALIGTDSVANHLLNYAGIIAPSGDYYYYVGGDGDLHIVDVSTPGSPSDVGTASVIAGNADNEAITGLAFDSTGGKLYVPNGNTSMYTLDLTDPESPTLDHTLTVTTAATNNRHVLVRDGSTLYLMGDTSFQKIDISTPSTPSVSSTLSATTTIGAGVSRAAITPDGDYVAFPELNTGTPAGQIGLIDITGTPAEGTPLDLPDFTGPVTITVSGNVIFDSSIDTDLMWFIGAYTSGGNTSYFWMTYAKGITWEDAQLVSDSIASGIVIPTRYISNEPYDSIAHLVVDNEIIVEKTRSTSGEGAFLSFWELEASELFPHLVVKEGAHQTEQITDLFLFASIDAQTDLICGVGQQQTVTPSATTLTGAMASIVPTSVTITDSGWQDITQYVLTTGIEVSYGITGAGVNDRIANTGTMRFSLNNTSPEGLFSPDHTNLKTGFIIGAPIRLQVSDTTPANLKTKFLGRIETITPAISVQNDNTVSVTCVDSMDILSRATSRSIALRTNITADRIIDRALDLAVGLPITSNWTNSLDSTPDIFPFAFDQAQRQSRDDRESSLAAEVQRAVESERGYFYPAYQTSGVGTDGGFRFESRETRKASPVLLSLDNIVSDITTTHAQDEVTNRVEVRITPREQDANPTTILFTAQEKYELDSAESVTFNAPYRDPDERSISVSGIDMQPPLATTDYTFNGSEDGSGVDLTDNLSVHVEFGASSAEVTLLNLGAPGFVTLFQLKGRGLYTYDAVKATSRDIVSIVQHGLSDATVDIPYESAIGDAQTIADSIVGAYKDPRTTIRSTTFGVGTKSAALDAFLDGEIGDKYFIENDVLGITKGTTAPFTLNTSELNGTDELADEAAVYVIHSVGFSIIENRISFVTWGLFPADVRLD